MADTQRTIEYLIAFKKQGQELLDAIPKVLSDISKEAFEAVEAFQNLSGAGDAAAQRVQAGTQKISASLGNVEQAAKAASSATAGVMNVPAGALPTELSNVGAAFVVNTEKALAFGNVAAESFEQAAAAAKGATGAAAGFGGMLRNLRSNLGRGSTAGLFAQLLSGAGPVLAIALVLRQFEQIGKAVEDASAKYRAGEIDIGDYYKELIASLPLIGSVIHAYDSISEAITGNQYAAKKAADELKAYLAQVVKAADESAKAVKAAKDSYLDVRSMDEENAKLHREAATSRLPDGASKSVSARSDAWIDEQQRIGAQSQAALEKAGASASQIAALQAKYDDLLKQVEAAGGPIGPGGKIMPFVYDARDQLNAAKSASANITAERNKNLDDSDSRLHSSIGDIVARDAREKDLKLGEDIKKLWDEVTTAFTTIKDKASAEINAEVSKLQQQANQITDSKINPDRRYDDQVKNLDRIKGTVGLSPEVYSAQLAEFQKEKDQEISAANKAESEKAVVAQEAIVATTTGYQQMVEQNKLSYMRDVENWKEQLDLKHINNDQYELLIQKAAQDQVSANAASLAQMKIDQDEFNVAITTGIAQEQANAQASYDKDVATWQDALNKKRITVDQFNAYQVERQQQLQDQLQQVQRKKEDAGLQNKLLVDQSSHNTPGAQLDQITIDMKHQQDQINDLHRQGLLSEQEYQDGLIAIDQEANEKRSEINGTFADGVVNGFKKMSDTAESQEKIGEKVADDFATGFGTAFQQIVTGSKKVGDAFKGMIASILSDFAKMEAESGIKTLLGALFGGGSGGGSGASAGASAVGAGIKAIFSAFNTGGIVPGYADGGVAGGGAWGPDRDTMLAKLTPGEGIFNRRAMRLPGMHDFLKAANAGHNPIALASSLSSGIQQQSFTSVSHATAASASGPSAGNPIIAAIPATDAHVATLLNGGRNSAISFMRQNYHLFAPRGR